MNRFSYILALSGLLVTLSTCFRVEGDLFDAGNNSLREGVTVYLENSMGLASETLDNLGNLAWIFSDFDADGLPQNARAVSFRPVGQDLRYHLLLDEQQRVRYLFASRSNGERMPALVRIDYPSDNACRLFLFSTGSGQPYSLEWQLEVDKSGGDFIPLPVYVRDECDDLQRVRDRVGEVFLLLQRVFPAAFLSTPEWLRVDALSALEQLVSLLTNACGQPSRTTLAAPDQTRVPENPEDLRSTLENLTSARPCNGAGAVSFEVERLSNGQARFIHVSGGQSPYGFSLGGGAWQADALFTGNYAADRPYLLAVRSASGCISARFELISRVSAAGKIARVAVQRRAAGQSVFQVGRVYSFQYDNLGRVDVITSPGIPSDNQELRYTYSYNSQGQLDRYSRERSAPGGGPTTLVRTFTYIGEGLIDRITETTGGATGQFVASYDAAGRVASLEMAGGGVVYSYDSRNNLTRFQEMYTNGESTIYTYAYSTDAPSPLLIFPAIFEPLQSNIGGFFLIPLTVNSQQSPNRLNRMRVQQVNGGSTLTDCSYRLGADGRLEEIHFDAADGSAEVLTLEYVN